MLCYFNKTPNFNGFETEFEEDRAAQGQDPCGNITRRAVKCFSNGSLKISVSSLPSRCLQIVTPISSSSHDPYIDEVGGSTSLCAFI